MDLIIGKGQKSAILTLCERSRNYLLMARLPYGKNPEKVAEMAIRLLLPYRKNVLTITTDNGGEFYAHKKIAKALDTTVYFADSYASWQKGTIENQNKLIRQYIPKGTDCTNLTDDFIKNIQYKINRRPREKLNFSTPKKGVLQFNFLILHLLIDSAKEINTEIIWIEKNLSASLEELINQTQAKDIKAIIDSL